MAIGIPGRTGSTRQTELGALNEIIKRLTDLKTTFTSGGGATLAEQQAQTTLLQQIENNTDGLEVQLVLSKDAGAADADTLRVVLEDQSRNNLISLQDLITANAPSHNELTNPSSVSYIEYKELSFVCSGTITVTLDGNSIIYPYSLGSTNILGSTIKADVSSTNAVTFNGTGTVLITIMKA